jgi:hypothetical protein
VTSQNSDTGQLRATRNNARKHPSATRAATQDMTAQHLPGTVGTASPRHHLLVRRHLKTSELAFHYCYVLEGQLLTKTRLIRAAGLR